MTTDPGYPVSVLLDGPLFRDELETQPQHFRRDHEIDSLRLVPAKSGANGVYTIYFRSDHRHWALVRLASRYRGLFEIQIQRGMSGEHQLFRQGFTSGDLSFLADIIPRPPKEHNPIVYDILWLIATYEEYLTLARALYDKKTFTPHEVLTSTPDVSVEDAGFFTRFLRSHLIQPISQVPDATGSRSTGGRSDISVEREAVYKVTDAGAETLEGIVSEHERIFEQRDFDPLLINPELDPLEHLAEYDAGATEPILEVSSNDVRCDRGILGEIAESFAPIDEVLDSPSDSAPEYEGHERTRTDEERSDRRVEVPDDRLEEQSRVTGSEGTTRTDELPKDQPEVSEEQSAESTFDGFERSEVIDAAVAAASLIDDETLVRTTDVKAAVWQQVELDDRDRGVLWDLVQDVLLEMDGVHGRTGGRIWASSKYY